MPAFARAESGGAGKGGGGNVEELRAWLGKQLSGPLASGEKAGATVNSRGQGAKRARRGAGSRCGGGGGGAGVGEAEG